jgi:hypothetical protein
MPRSSQISLWTSWGKAADNSRPWRANTLIQWRLFFAGG